MSEFPFNLIGAMFAIVPIFMAIFLVVFVVILMRILTGGAFGASRRMRTSVVHNLEDSQKDDTGQVMMVDGAMYYSADAVNELLASQANAIQQQGDDGGGPTSSFSTYRPDVAQSADTAVSFGVDTHSNDSGMFDVSSSLTSDCGQTDVGSDISSN